MRTFKIVSRIFFVLSPLMYVGMALFLDVKTLIVPLLGMGCIVASIAFYLLLSTKFTNEFVNFDRYAQRVFLYFGLFLILGSMIKIKSNVTEYKNENEYKLEYSYFSGDTIPSSTFMVFVNSKSKILKDHKNIINFSDGKWIFDVDKQANKEKFVIKVCENKYLLGKRTYVNFYYNNTELDHYKAKFITYER